MEREVDNTDPLYSRKEHGESETNVEDQKRHYPFPKSVFFLSGFECFNSLGFFGLRSILVIYLTQKLRVSDDESTIIFHVMTMSSYLLSIIGAVVSDSWLGRFKTIRYGCLIYIIGPTLVTLGALPTFSLNAKTFTLVGLAFITMGSGALKPSLTTFGGDQFTLPEQAKQLSKFFFIYYFSTNVASLLSTAITPILREDVHCFGEQSCYSFAFGMSIILMIIAIAIFAIGNSTYIIRGTSGNMVVLVSKAIGHALVSKFRESRTNPKPHWLDYSEEKYGTQLVEDVKVLFRILLLYLPLPIYWALYDQQGSRWTLQATRMNGNFGTFDLKPDQLQLLNPLLILFFIPMFDKFIYPILSLVGLKRPLQKLTLGLIFTACSFIISGVLEVQLEATYPVLPGAQNAQLRIYNGDPCAYIFSSTSLPTFTVPEYGYYENKNINFAHKNLFLFEYNITSNTAGCGNWSTGSKEMQERHAYSLFLGSNTASASASFWYEETVEKPSQNGVARTLANLRPDSQIKWSKGSNVIYEQTAERALTELISLDFGTYNIFVNNNKVGEVQIEVGGVYSVLISMSSVSDFVLKKITVTEPNTINILWLIPQYVVLTLAEVLFAVTGLEFSYAQAPLSLKSVVSACWLLTVALGNIIIIIVTEARFFEYQSTEFFFFSGLMFADMIIFMLLAWNYKPNNPNQALD